MHGCLVHVVAVEELLLAADLAVLIPNIERLGHELLAVTLPSVCYGMRLRARSAGKATFLRSCIARMLVRRRGSCELILG